MKLKILGLAAGATLLGLTATSASAGTDIYVGIDLGAPVVVERRPAYYYEREPVVYYERHYVYEPRYEVRYEERYEEVRYEPHDRGRHRGHYKHHHHH